MTQFLIVFGIMAAVGVLGYFFWWRPKQKNKIVKNQRGCPAGTSSTTANDICLPLEWAYQIDRADGGWMIVAVGTKPPQDVCDRAAARASQGIANSIAEWRRDYPQNSRNMMDGWQHGIVFIPKMATNMDCTPALVTNGIQTAGTVINVFPESGGSLGQQTIVLPIPDNWDDPHYLDYLEASAHNEDEHVMEYNNDLNLFLHLMGAGDVHPHRQPISTQPLGLVSRTSLTPSCGAKFTMNPTASPVKIKGLKTVKV